MTACTPSGISRGQPANHPGLVNMPQLTPIPVIMAPTLPRLTSALQLRDASRVSAVTKCCSKRKALEELEPNTLNKPEVEAIIFLYLLFFFHYPGMEPVPVFLNSGLFKALSTICRI